MICDLLPITEAARLISGGLFLQQTPNCADARIILKGVYSALASATNAVGGG